MTTTAQIINHPTTETMDVATLIANMTDMQMIHLPLYTISAREGFNPRRYFSPDKMKELVDSIKAQGLIQPIVVKPNVEGTALNLIAGERRFRAANLAQIETIPVIVRLVSDNEALAIAVSENSEREDVSAGEEAKACHRMMAICSGDKDETARTLGWSRKKLDSRLMLLHCSPSVLDALEQRKILIGHAELLSGLSREMQDQTLTGLIDSKVSVTVLREKLDRYAYKLNEAIFDTNACSGCPHNSTSTADLFDLSLNDGHCMNRDCYDEKTTVHLHAKKAELSEEYPVIWLDIERPADTRCHLVREGENGVGKSQHVACQGCASFGAVMATSKGNEGDVDSGVCFDTACNKKKIAEYQQEVSQQEKISLPAENPTATTSKANQTTTTTTKIVNKSDGTNSVETPKKVKTFIYDKHIHACASEVINNVSMVKIFSLIALTKAVNHSFKTDLIDPLLKQYDLEILKRHYLRADMVHTLSKLDDASINQLIRAYTATLAGGHFSDTTTSDTSENVTTAQAVLSIVNADMTQYFSVDKAYLSTLTISGLKALLDEAGFIAWYDDAKGEGSCTKEILSGKRDDQLKAVLATEFCWEGFIPKTAHLPESKSTVKQS